MFSQIFISKWKFSCCSCCSGLNSFIIPLMGLWNYFPINMVYTVYWKVLPIIGLIPLDGVSNGMTQKKLHHESKQETNLEKKFQGNLFWGLISSSKSNVFLTWMDLNNNLWFCKMTIWIPCLEPFNQPLIQQRYRNEIIKIIPSSPSSHWWTGIVWCTCKERYHTWHW